MKDETKPRKGKLWLWLGGFGLLVLLGVASLPFWAGGPAAGFAAGRFNDEHAGRLEVGGLDLSWTGRQAARGVQLFDPEGELVAEVEVDLPSLLDLARGRGKRVGEVLIRATADLVAGEDGSSNLERALAPKPGTKAPGAKSKRGSESDTEGGGLEELDLFVGLDCPRLTWSDARTRALGAPFELRDVKGEAILRPGQPISVRLDGAMPAPAGAGPAGDGPGGERPGAGKLHVKADLRGLLAGDVPPSAEIDADISGLPTGLVDALAGLDGLLGPSLGETFDLRAKADGGLESGRVSIEVKGAHGGLSFLGGLQDGVLSAFGPDEGLDVRFSDPTHVLDRYLTPSLPEGGALSAGGLVLSLREFSIPVPPIGEQAGGEPVAFDQAKFLEQVSASFGMTLDRASLSLPELPGGPLEVANVLFSAMVEPEQPFVLSLSSDLPPSGGGSAEPGAINVSVDVLGLDALLANAGASEAAGALEAEGAAQAGDAGDPADAGPGWEAHFRGNARGIETSRVDALLAQQGLLVDAIGASSAVEFSGVWPPTEEPMTLSLDAPGASLAFTGVLEDGVLSARGEQTLAARLPLSPLLSERVVGPLLPMMLQLEQPAGVGPLGLTVSDFQLPLDGDLSGLSATVRLELGEVAYELIPGLSDLLAKFGEQNVKQTTSFDSFALRIEQGVARYDGLPVRIEGHDVLFDGAFNLASREFDFDAGIPLAVFGDGVVRELDKARKYLDPGLSIPVELSGSWRSPKIRVAKSFLETTVRQAAEGAVKKGLFDLLEKELGKDR